MGSFAIMSKLSQKQATAFYKQATKWFKDNPKRTDANTDVCHVRKAHLAEDILAVCLDGVTLPPPARKPRKK
jgi:hypothetical protein